MCTESDYRHILGTLFRVNNGPMEKQKEADNTENDEVYLSLQIRHGTITSFLMERKCRHKASAFALKRVIISIAGHGQGLQQCHDIYRQKTEKTWRQYLSKTPKLQGHSKGKKMFQTKLYP